MASELVSLAEQVRGEIAAYGASGDGSVHPTRRAMRVDGEGVHMGCGMGRREV